MAYKYYAPFIPTPHDVVDKMLQAGKVNANDVVYDLGCGDGRILFAAVKQFNAKKAVGFEIRKDLYKNTLQEIEEQQLKDRVTIHNMDFQEAELSEATVITLYLTGTANSNLRPKLEKECKPGTRVISRVFVIEGWKPLLTDRESDIIHIYQIPDSLRKQGSSPR